MTFTESVGHVLANYARFGGRAGRPEFWYWLLAIFAVSIGFLLLVWIFGGAIGGIINGAYFVYSLAVLVPTVAVSSRRLHDTGRSAWWLLVYLVPLAGWLILLVLCAQPSDPNWNDYGTSPA